MSQTKNKKFAIIATIIGVIAIGVPSAYLVSAQTTETMIPLTQQEKEKNNALEVAKIYIVTSPTFAFDGDINTLDTEYVGSLESLPPQYLIRMAFDSANGGFGNREGQMLTQAITPHKMDIIVSEGKVISAITDETWDEMKELFIQRLADPDFSMDVPEVYSYASFIEAFEKKNISLEVVEILEDSSFSVSAIVLSVNGENIQTYEFSSADEAQEASLLVSEDGTEIGTSIIRWMDEPHFYTQGKIIVQYIGHNPEIMNLLDSFLGKQFAGM
jgi:hypothetical protein